MWGFFDHIVFNFVQSKIPTNSLIDVGMLIHFAVWLMISTYYRFTLCLVSNVQVFTTFPPVIILCLKLFFLQNCRLRANATSTDTPSIFVILRPARYRVRPPQTSRLTPPAHARIIRTYPLYATYLDVGTAAAPRRVAPYWHQIMHPRHTYVCTPLVWRSGFLLSLGSMYVCISSLEGVPGWAPPSIQLDVGETFKGCRDYEDYC